MKKEGKTTKKEVLEFYKYCFRCNRCLELYGSDSPWNGGICPKCDKRKGNRFRNKRKTIAKYLEEPFELPITYSPQFGGSSSFY